MKTKNLKIAFLTFLFLGSIHAQDIHFSAADYAPMTVNPGLVGVQYELQGSVNYRNQWSSVGAPFQTIAAGYDMRFGETQRNKKGFLAAGIHFTNDASGSNKIEMNNLGLSVAYHLKLNTKTSLALGLQGAWGQRTLKMADGQWGTQFNGLQYDAELPSGETFNNSSFSYFDAAAGLVYSYRPIQMSKNNNGTRVDIGISAYHLNRPSVSFIKDGTDPLHIRTTAFLRAEIGLEDKYMAFEPQLRIQFQGPSVETLLGTDYRFFLGDRESIRGHYRGTSLAVGLFVRNQDALISRLSLRLKDFDLGMAYDFNTFSSLKRVSKSKGAVEIFMRYVISNSVTRRSSRI